MKKNDVDKNERNNFWVATDVVVVVAVAIVAVAVVVVAVARYCRCLLNLQRQHNRKEELTRPKIYFLFFLHSRLKKKRKQVEEETLKVGKYFAFSFYGCFKLWT